MKHVPALDGLRGIAISMVLIFHAALAGGLIRYFEHPAMKALSWACGIGWSGVDLFFVLSGFLITGILLDTRDRPNYFRNFYARRSLRIFPLYYATVAIRLGLPWLFPLYQVGAWESVAYLTYTTNIYESLVGPESRDPYLSVAWSLAVEEQFYIAWSLMVFVLSRRAMTVACLAILPAALALRVGMDAAHVNEWAIYVLTPCRVDGFAMGALVAIARRSDWGWRAAITTAKLMLAPAALGVAAVVLVLRNPMPDTALMQTIGFTCLEILWGCVLVFVLNGAASQSLQCWPLTQLGKYSYAVYLFHFALMHSMRTWQFDFPILKSAAILLLGGGGAIVLAIVSWHLLEARCLSLKKYFE